MEQTVISNIIRGITQRLECQQAQIDTCTTWIQELLKKIEEIKPAKKEPECQCPFVIGEYYKTRGGEKVRFDRWCYTEEKAYFRRISDNFCMTTNPDGRYSCFKCCDNDVIGPWEEEECPFVVGKFYKTREGGKVEFLKYWPSRPPHHQCQFSHTTTSLSGNFWSERKHYFDIIGPWKDELQLEVGKTYLDERLNKVFIYYWDDQRDTYYGVKAALVHTFYYDKNGKGSGLPSLVSEVK